MCAGLFYLNKWDMGQALVTTLKINKLQAFFLASVYGRGIVA